MKRNQEEHRIQCGIIKWAREPINIRRWPALATLHAIPNGGARDARTGAMLKREGVLKGVWDLFLPSWGWTHINKPKLLQVNGWSGLYIEVKTPRGRLTKEQSWFGAMATHQGYATYIARSTQSGINAITAYLDGRFLYGEKY